MNVETGDYSSGFIVGWDPAGAGIYGAIAGTAGHPITIQADPSAAAGSVRITARGSNKTPTGIDLEPGCDYITVIGFTIINDSGNSISKAGIKFAGNYDRFLNNKIINTGRMGILSLLSLRFFLTQPPQIIA